MLKVLRRRFVFISMALVFVVMTAVLATGLIANHVQFTREYEIALAREQLSDPRKAPRDFFNANLPRPGEEQVRPKLSFTALESTDKNWTLATPWMQMDEETLLILVQRAQGASKSTGFWSDLGIAYERKEGRIAFVNLQNELAQLQSSQLAWTLVYVGALSVFFAISLLLSKQVLRPVETAWIQQRRFVSDASHELKTPLTVILANLDIAEKEMGDNQWLASARTEGQQMKQLIESLLFLARSDEVNQSIPKEQLDLSTLVQETALAFEALAYENGLQFSLDIRQNLHTTGNPALLRQLCTILIDNAIKYTPEKGMVQVLLKATKEDKVLLRVNNSPAFIAKEHLDHLFDRFYRTDEARTKSNGGYGLGLAIAGEIARQHHADIKAASSLEEGTSVTVFFIEDHARSRIN